MTYLVLGLVLFLGVHSISIVAPAWRDRVAARLGVAWRAAYSVVSIAGFILVIVGYGMARSDPHVLYTPPAWGRHAATLLMVPVFPLLLAPYFPGRIKDWMGHPMLLGVTLWSTAHLIATGSRADVVLFGSFLAWSVADRMSYRWRVQRPIAGAPPSRFNDLIAVVAGLAIYFVFGHWLHARWIGVQPF